MLFKSPSTGEFERKPCPSLVFKILTKNRAKLKSLSVFYEKHFVDRKNED
jgi:hypothetical protein